MSTDTIAPVDHVEVGLSRPSFKLKEAENFLKLLEIFLEKLNEVEEAFLDLADQKDLENVTGVWLDYIGKIVGEFRKGRSDEEYRDAIKLKVGINNSDGTPNIISELIQTTVKADRVRIVEGKIAWGQLIVTTPESISSSTYELLESIRAAGVWILLAYDINNTAFYPAWEVNSVIIPSVEEFEVVTSLVTEVLEVSLSNGAIIEPFEIRRSGGDFDTVFTYLEGTTGRQVIEWEDVVEFWADDGAAQEGVYVQVSAGVSGQLCLTGVPNKKNTITALWEADETHTGTVTQ